MNHPRLLTALPALLLSACVTINIYFPAAQAEQAAERIVEDILGKQPPASTPVPPPESAPKPPPTTEPAPKGAALEGSGLLLRTARLVAAMIPAAEAAEPNFEIDSPEIRQLQARMKERNPSLTPFYTSGAVGFADNALLAIRDAESIPLRDRNKVQSLVDAENADRNALYRAIAQANGHPEWEPQVRQVFARKWVEKAGPGWWYRSAGGSWKQK